ncbi:hypothetical protein FA13DRAFT_1726317 [Coprinellus micaceus]|uniref:Uncharacterized protein n=1 Tax=Coprinellus micaceus TaxID=71717 RepID=A0A4Y7TTM0_COPMI|nr:hypothetical protein FA13DRAFT_1726317 [Coprinellus micaceus]
MDPLCILFSNGWYPLMPSISPFTPALGRRQTSSGDRVALGGDNSPLHKLTALAWGITTPRVYV